MLNQKIIFITLIAYCLLLIAPAAEAHVLMTDKSIGAVVHISPDDDPIAGEPANFFFDFKDKDNKFDPKSCECIYQIKQGDTVIAQGDLFSAGADPSLENASFSVTFPEVGVYTLTLTGNPQNPGQFSDFVLTDSIRVERSSADTRQPLSQSTNFFTGHWIHFVVFGAGGIIFLILLLFKTKKSPE
jgi:hypothetical protein